MFNRINPDSSKKSFLRDLNVAENFRPQDSGFDFAFSTGLDLDDTIYTIDPTFVNYYYTGEVNEDGSFKRVKDRVTFDYDKCD